MKRIAFPIFLLAIAVLLGACHNKQGGEKKKFGSKQKDIIRLPNCLLRKRLLPVRM